MYAHHFYELDLNAYRRDAFINGYEAAEKDIALTWEDVKEIVRIADGMMYSADSLADIEKRLGIQPYYTEVLTRFKQFKETKDGNDTIHP